MDIINLSSYNFGPEELDWLLEEWLKEKDPKPKTINEIARIYRTHQIKAESGFWPYDICRGYKEKDRIIVRLRKGEELFDCTPAEVLSVAKNAYCNMGYYGDYIDVRLLSTDSKLDSQRIRTFVANYQGPGFSIPEEFKAFEIITDKDENKIIPQILIAISNDAWFVAFREQWFPKQLLINDIKDKLTRVEEIIARAKYALSTSEILEQLRPENNRGDSDSRLEFTLNYFLDRDKDKRFVLISDPVTKWDLRKPSVLDKPEETQSTITIEEDWIAKSIIILPKRLSDYMKGTNTVHLIYDQVDELLPYEEKDRLIEGLKNFYSIKAVAEFDKVNLRLESLEPTRLFIVATWQKSLDKLLSIEPQDLDWENSSLRDCIIVILAKFKTPATYREVYSEIAPHKNTSLSSINATLSHYSPSVFTHVGRGKWQLAGWEGEKTPEGERPENERPPIITKLSDEEIWKVVQLIEEKEYVYKLLQKIRKPLSFNDICEKLSDILKIDANKLKATAFLKANDKRLRRLDASTWALEEWFKQSPPDSEEALGLKADEDINEPVTSLGKTIKSGMSRLFWAIVLILFFLITIGVILFWLFI